MATKPRKKEDRRDPFVMPPGSKKGVGTSAGFPPPDVGHPPDFGQKRQMQGRVDRPRPSNLGEKRGLQSEKADKSTYRKKTYHYAPNK